MNKSRLEPDGDSTRIFGILSTPKDIKKSEWSNLKAALSVLKKTAVIMPALQSATGSLISHLNLFEEAEERYGDYGVNPSHLKAIATSLARHLRNKKSARTTNLMIRLSRIIYLEVRRLGEQDKQSGANGQTGAPKEYLRGVFQRIELLYQRLWNEVDWDVWNVGSEDWESTWLDRLDSSNLTCYNSKLGSNLGRRTCTPNTHEELLSKLNIWADDPSGVRTYFMSGVEGTGKTTIAYTLAKELESRGQLGASFFCTPTSPECRDATRIVPNIAYQFAQHSTPFLHVLCEVMGKEPTRIQNITASFHRLVKIPLLRVKEKIPPNLVVIIDGLDQCDDDSEVLKLVLSMFLQVVPMLPIKFFITSRLDSSIQDVILRYRYSIGTVHLHGLEVGESLAQLDIKTYFRKELASISPLETHIEQLTDLAGGLFVHAVAIVRCIQANDASIDSRESLEIILNANPRRTAGPPNVDKLYHALLVMVFNRGGPDAKEVQHRQSVLSAAVCIRGSATLETLAMLAGMNEKEQTIEVLRILQPILHITEDSQLISILSASFRDYILDQGRSGRFSCDEVAQNQLLIRRCFDVMKAQLRFNICGLKSSFVRDRDVGDLAERIEGNISPVLEYACRYWGDHLRFASTLDDFPNILNEFLSHRLLFWMEVLNLKGWTKDSIKALLKAKEWLKTINNVPDLQKFINDAYIFVYRFAAAPISESTPHIYISALALCPRSSFVSRKYRNQMQGLMNTNGAAICDRDPTALATWFEPNTNSEVISVAFSPAGNNIVCGSADGVIHVRDAIDGTIIGGPFQAHEDLATFIEISPDGTWVASSSRESDKNILVWRLVDGASSLYPEFKGHTDTVLSVAFSSDSLQIASGSVDRTVIVWDIRKHKLAAGPFRGHTGAVNSVGFSPDGKRVVSGSSDRTIRVWDITHGVVVVGPITDSDSIVSVIFSPDGTQIASGSSNSTICIWDAIYGTPVAEPFRGHTSTVRCLCFSLDGVQLVSGSDDQTIRIWDIHGTLVAGPFLGHSAPVHSLAFSPDGTSVISCAGGFAIRLWDATHNTPIPRPFIAPAPGKDKSVAFSPDGTRIVSGADDNTICIWDASDGTLVAGPFRGHTGSVWSVAFSPDGARVVSGSEDHTVIIWDILNRTLAVGPLQHHTTAVHSVGFLPDGTRIVSGSDNGIVYILDSVNGVLVAEPHRLGGGARALSVAFSSDGARIASGSDDSTIHLWDSIAATPIPGPLEKHEANVLSVGFSPDGTRVVSGSDDHTICVWDATRRTLVAEPFTGHEDSVHSVAFSPDGAYIASGSSDCTIRIWDTYGTLAFRPLKLRSRVLSVAFSPDGAQIVSISGGSTSQCDIRVWNTHPNNIPAPLRGQWTRGRDRWTSNYRSELLFWVPFEITGDFPTPFNPLIIGSKGALQIDYRNMLLGDDWHKCFLGT